jgi:activator of 2-hydroxyglutaryl-CoA dehydratase
MLNILGIDIGSVALSIVTIDKKGRVTHSAYEFHRGDIANTLWKMLAGLDIAKIGGIAMTASGPDILQNIPRYANRHDCRRQEISRSGWQYLICGRRKFRVDHF